MEYRRITQDGTLTIETPNDTQMIRPKIGDLIGIEGNDVFFLYNDQKHLTRDSVQNARAISKEVTICELCKQADYEMDFNCLMPSFNALLQAYICGPCWSSEESDMHVAVKVIKVRIADLKLIPPLSMEKVSKLLDIRSS